MKTGNAPFQFLIYGVAVNFLVNIHRYGQGGSGGEVGCVSTAPTCQGPSHLTDFRVQRLHMALFAFLFLLK